MSVNDIDKLDVEWLVYQGQGEIKNSWFMEEMKMTRMQRSIYKLTPTGLKYSLYLHSVRIVGVGYVLMPNRCCIVYDQYSHRFIRRVPSGSPFSQMCPIFNRKFLNFETNLFTDGYGNNLTDNLVVSKFWNGVTVAPLPPEQQFLSDSNNKK